MRMSRVAMGRSRIRKDWRDKLQKGDVIVSRAGAQRVVRNATYDEFGLLIGINLVIKKCSWTRRCYTTLVRSDIRSMGFHPPVARVRLRSRLDKLIARAIDDYATRPLRLTCCEVHGVA